MENAIFKTKFFMVCCAYGVLKSLKWSKSDLHGSLILVQFKMPQTQIEKWGDFDENAIFRQIAHLIRDFYIGSK
jgi:hypothetical protein